MITKDTKLAIQKLKDGDVVAIPTETVYGLAGDIENEEAIKKIFATKKRPSFDPLIVHVDEAGKAKKLAKWGPLADFLAHEFWPGPLTIIVPKLDTVNPLITAGLDSVALRCPDHEDALRVLVPFAGLAAPSANMFGKTSPTQAEHVDGAFEEDVLVLDGGACQVGIESTVVGIVSSAEIEIYRPGMITKEQLQERLHDKYERKVLVTYAESPVAPGQLKHHYMPDIPVIFNKSNKNHEDIMTMADLNLNQKFTKPVTIELNRDPVITARVLYQKFREASAGDFDLIIVKGVEGMDQDDWKGILNRLDKASKLTV